MKETITAKRNTKGAISFLKKMQEEEGEEERMVVVEKRKSGVLNRKFGKRSQPPVQSSNRNEDCSEGRHGQVDECCKLWLKRELLCGYSGGFDI